MSTPVTTPTELGVYFDGQPLAADDARALLIIALAQSRCERYLSPLPPAAKDVVLPVAARAWANVISANQIGLGSGYATMANAGKVAGGMYVSRSEKADLRRLGGRSGAFSIDLLPRGRSEIQAVIVEATAGTYVLGYQGQLTDPIPFDASAAQVEAALAAAVGAGNASVSDGFLVTFKGALANSAVDLLTADDTALTGTVTVVTIQQGQPSPRGL